MSDGSATYTSLSVMRIAAGTAQDYRLDITDNAGTVDNGFTLAVNYTDDAGAAFTVNTASTVVITAPSPTPSPSPTPAPAPSPSGYAVNWTASCTKTATTPGNGFSPESVFTIVQSGTATGPDVGAWFDFPLPDGVGNVRTQASCGSWSRNGDACKHASGQSATTSWTLTSSNYVVTDRSLPYNVRLNIYVYDSTGHSRAEQVGNVTCR